MLNLSASQINTWQNYLRQQQGGIIRRGIEKEGLRVDCHGKISQRKHPEALGAKLTHPYITTDYAESLLEFVTPVHCRIEDTLQFLADLHTFSYQHLEDEIIWPASMPAILAGDESVPIADYGTSNSGKMKEVYRRGLALRYGRIMQTIAGIHYNFSFAECFWDFWCEMLANPLKSDIKQIRSNAYFRMIRNFHRSSWLLMYLFGASPAFDQSFIDKVPAGFMAFGKRSVMAANACSLRMSDLGYHNNVQNQLAINLNSLSQYVQTLRHAVNTPWPPYMALGIEVDGFWRQLNGNILQIENEFYTDIRPKRIAPSGQTPSYALATEGVQYIEVRCLDINPLLPLGIDEMQIRFLDAFLLHTLLADDFPITNTENGRLNANRALVVSQGRRQNLKLQTANGLVSLQAAAKELMAEIEQCALLLDSQEKLPLHQQAVTALAKRIDSPELIPAGQISAQLQSQPQDFVDWTLKQAQKQSAEFKANKLTKVKKAMLTELAQISWQQQRQLEAQPQEEFASYLAKYFAQNRV